MPDAGLWRGSAPHHRSPRAAGRQRHPWGGGAFVVGKLVAAKEQARDRSAIPAPTAPGGRTPRRYAVSVINKMLRDLDHRQAPAPGASTAKRSEEHTS